MPYAFGGRPLDPRMVPTRPVRLNRGSPLAQGLQGLWLPGIYGALDISQTIGPGGAFGAPVGGSAAGPALVLSGQYSVTPPFAKVTASQQWTAAAIMAPAAATVPAAGTIAISNGWNSWGLAIGQANSTWVTSVVTTSPVAGYSAAFGTPVVGQAAFISGSYASPTISGYLNGVLGASTSTGSGLRSSTTRGSLGAFPTGGQPWTGNCPLIVLYDYAFSSAQHAELAAEPFGMLEDATPRLWFPVSSGPAPTPAPTSAPIIQEMFIF